MRPLLRRFPALGGLQLFALLGAAMFAFTAANQTILIVTNTNDNGPGSLRQALADAQDGDTIQFDPALNGWTITLTSGELAIAKNLTITGPGPDQLSISGSSASRIFHIMSGHTVGVEGLTIKNGHAAAQSGGGGILNEGTLSLGNSTVRSNSANTGGGTSSGGGIANVGTITITNSMISGNGAELSGGAIFNDGTMTITNSMISGNSAPGAAGGIASSGNLTIVNSTVSSNYAVHGGLPSGGFAGGIYVDGGSLELIQSTISNNTGALYGGGIQSDDGTITITDSIISGNRSAEGGGIQMGGTATVDIRNSTINGNIASFNGGISNHGTLTIRNSTLSGNSASSQGGALGTGGGGATITNCTISGNTAPQGGVSLSVNGRLDIGNTILNAGSSSANIVQTGTNMITSLGYNLSSDNAGGFLTGPGDQINTDPMLGPLQDNGGPTFTHDLLTGSPAINTGDPNFTPPPSTDQRGYYRVVTGRIDIGSLEVQPTLPPIAISGTISYCSNPVSGPVPNVILTLTGSSSGSTLSNSSGNYQFSSLPSGASYIVTPGKAPRLPGSAGIDTVDVVATQRHFLIIGPPLTGCRLTAADANGDSAVNTIDVVSIQRFFLQLTTGIANVGSYQFTPTNRTYLNLNSNQAGQNYNALVFGDVTSPYVH
jgi:hypothetical protein